MFLSLGLAVFSSLQPKIRVEIVMTFAVLS